ncbi:MULTISPECIES: GtrA family protein [Streptomyces]|uniref:GtrA family protein n=1 Tax=Streptomyces huasconensis TaxID=1854574 RepID=A0ABV3LNF6_9ACTN|nr:MULTISPECIES: GtrA family protein [Streptomyces]UFQ17595.1 GtrA family protein [Streptomyces huasconensis]WCL87200.1 GtrA family protein [Streptomyces sp. JCM 35825]
MSWISLRARLRSLGPELLGFAAAGICAYAVDLGLFIWLRGPVGLDPLTAKSLSFVAGCSVAYAGNALGTYRRKAAGVSRLRQYAVFFAVNVAGALVQLLCIAVSHYGLGLTSQRADTVSGAGVGMALATVLRFWGTRTLVFRVSGRTAGTSSDRTAGREATEATWTG